MLLANFQSTPITDLQAYRITKSCEMNCTPLCTAGNCSHLTLHWLKFGKKFVEHFSQALVFPRIAIKTNAGALIVRETEKVLGEKITTRTEEVPCPVTGVPHLRTVQLVEKLIETEVVKQQKTFLDGGKLFGGDARHSVHILFAVVYFIFVYMLLALQSLRSQCFDFILFWFGISFVVVFRSNAQRVNPSWILIDFLCRYSNFSKIWSLHSNAPQ